MLAWRSGFYGYFNVFCTFLAFIMVAEPFYSLSVLTPYMAKEMGWSATQFGGAFSFVLLLLAITAPFVGIFIARFGPRRAMIGGALLVTITMALLSTTRELWQFYALCILLGIGISTGGSLAAQQMVNNWFLKRRAFVLGLVMTGGGIGGAIAAPAVQGIINISGSWRVAWLVMSGAVFFVLVVAVLFIRNRPEELGQRVDGATGEAIPEAGAAGKKGPPPVFKTEHNWEVRAALKTKAFWLIMLAVGAQSWALQGIVAHQVAYLRWEVGVDATVAAAALGLMTGFSIFGRVPSGWLGDRLEPRLIMGSFLVLMALSLVLLLSWPGIVPLYIYVALFGIGYGGIVVPKPAILVNYFGVKNFAPIMGLGLVLTQGLGAVSPLVAGGIKDITGTYLPVFYIMVVICLAGAVCSFYAKPPVLKAAKAVLSLDRS